MKFLHPKLKLLLGVRYCSTVKRTSITINEKEYPCDSYTNVTDRILSLTNRKLYAQKYHPLCLMKERIVDFFYNRFKNSRGNPIFTVSDKHHPVVTTFQNFDSLLIPKDHVSRSNKDCYYVNSNELLRAHMTAHQFELLKSGLDNFLMVGDVYRRDEIDAAHYPVFHQLDAVKLFSPQEVKISFINVEILTDHVLFLAFYRKRQRSNRATSKRNEDKVSDASDTRELHARSITTSRKKPKNYFRGLIEIFIWKRHSVSMGGRLLSIHSSVI